MGILLKLHLKISFITVVLGSCGTENSKSGDTKEPKGNNTGNSNTTATNPDGTPKTTGNSVESQKSANGTPSVAVTDENSENQLTKTDISKCVRPKFHFSEIMPFSEGIYDVSNAVIFLVYGTSLVLFRQDINSPFMQSGQAFNETPLFRSDGMQAKISGKPVVVEGQISTNPIDNSIR